MKFKPMECGCYTWKHEKCNKEYAKYKESFIKQGFIPVTFDEWLNFDKQDKHLKAINQEVA